MRIISPEKMKAIEELIFFYFEQKNAFFPGHFELTSKKFHTDIFLHAENVTRDPECAKEIGRIFADLYQDDEIEGVAGIPRGGISIAKYAAERLELLTGRPVRHILLEKRELWQAIPRFVEPADKEWIEEGRHVILTLEDIITTGQSTLMYQQSLPSKSAWKNRLYFVAIASRCATEFLFDVFADQKILADFSKFPLWKSGAKGDCPLCKKHIPLSPKP